MSRSEQNSRLRRELSKSRIEAYSDGVFSIVATLLVLEVRLPRPVQEILKSSDPSAEMLTAILHSWPHILGYILSFLTITIWWITHHHLFHVIQRLDRTALWLNSIFLMFLAILPFPTALLEAAPQNSVAVCFYGLAMVPIGLSIVLLRWYATVHKRLADPQISPELYASALKKGLLSPVLYLVAALLGYVVPLIGVTGYVLIAGYYVLPSALERKAVGNARAADS